MSWLHTDAALARDSYYAATSPWPPEPMGAALTWPDGEVDVAVVGGGLAGLSAAIELADRGRSVVLLEAGRVGGGASGRNGGQALHGLACEMAHIEAQCGIGVARQVWAMSLEALSLIHQRMQRFGIDAQWQSGYLLAADHSWRQRKAARLRAWADAHATRYGHAMQWLGPQDLAAHIDSPRFAGGVFDALCGHLHALRYTQGLARAAQSLGVQVFEGCAVQAIAPGQLVGLHTSRGLLQARQVLLAGNASLPALVPSLAQARVESLQGVRQAGSLGARIMPVGTYIVTTPPLPPGQLQALLPTKAAVCDSNFVLDYFRPTADGRLLFGGGVSYSTRTPWQMVQGMQARMVSTFPSLAGVPIEHAWGGFVDITLNRAPDFGRLRWPGLPPGAAANVYHLQGFSGHGLALSGLAGQLAAQALCGDASRFDVFARLGHRPFPGGAQWRTPLLMLGMACLRLRDLL